MSSVEKKIKRIAVGLAGGIVILIGVAMVVLPGPALIVIPAGLAILATEFPWARRALQKLKEKGKEMGVLKKDSSEEKEGEPQKKDESSLG